MALPAAPAALVLALLLAGCLVDGGEAADVTGIPEGAAAAGPNAGTPSGHGEPKRVDGGVTVGRDGLLATGRYVARQTVTITNDFGGASSASVALATGAGGVHARAWGDGGYKVVVLLEARADTEAEARSWLARLAVEHRDGLDGGHLDLATAVRFPDRVQDASLSATVTASLPSEPSYGLDLAAGSGAATTSGLRGPAAAAHTGSGGISLDGAFGRMVADAGSGGIELAGTANGVAARAGSGAIAARLGTGGGGLWTFTAGSGDVDVAVRRGGGAELDVTADAGSGDVEVDLSDGRDVGSQGEGHRRVRTSGYEDAAVKVRLQATTGSGDIRVAG